MRKSLLVASTILLTASGLTIAEGHPSFADADTNHDGALSAAELNAVFPQLEVKVKSAMLSAADVKRVMPEVDFSDIDVVNEEPIGEDLYTQIVAAINDMENPANASLKKN